MEEYNEQYEKEFKKLHRAKIASQISILSLIGLDTVDKIGRVHYTIEKNNKMRNDEIENINFIYKSNKKSNILKVQKEVKAINKKYNRKNLKEYCKHAAVFLGKITIGTFIINSIDDMVKVSEKNLKHRYNMED